jgi:TonB family protein
MKKFCLLWVLLFTFITNTAFSYNKNYPIYSPVDGRYNYYFEIPAESKMEDVDQYYQGVILSIKDYNTKKLHSFKGLVLEVSEFKEKCFEHHYMYDDIEMQAHNSFLLNIKKGDLIGYAKTKEGTKPVFIREYKKELCQRENNHIAKKASYEDKDLNNMVFPPKYPVSAIQQKQQGKVLIKVNISKYGSLLKARIEKSSNHKALDEAALNAVRKWKFTPAIDKNGNPIDSTISIPFVFEIK